jgi:hypothetical protein
MVMTTVKGGVRMDKDAYHDVGDPIDRSTRWSPPTTYDIGDDAGWSVMVVMTAADGEDGGDGGGPAWTKVCTRVHWSGSTSNSLDYWKTTAWQCGAVAGMGVRSTV